MNFLTLFKKKEKQPTSIVRYSTDKGEVVLSPSIIKNYLVSGDKERVTDQELKMFLMMCQYQRLNPFLREAYIIKFGNEPATLVTGKETFTKRAAKSKLIKGYEAGVVVQDIKTAIVTERAGSIVYPGEKLLGGWAEGYRKDRDKPIKIMVGISEYERRKKDGTLAANWRTMPATMIRKVALVQMLRELLPEEFEGLYSPEEMPIDMTTLPDEPIKIPVNETTGEIIEGEVVEDDTKEAPKLKKKPDTPAPPKEETTGQPTLEELKKRYKEKFPTGNMVEKYKGNEPVLLQYLMNKYKSKEI